MCCPWSTRLWVHRSALPGGRRGRYPRSWRRCLGVHEVFFYFRTDFESDPPFGVRGTVAACGPFGKAGWLAGDDDNMFRYTARLTFYYRV